MSRSSTSHTEPRTKAHALRADGQPLAGFLNTDWTPRQLPPGTTVRNVALRTSDGASTVGSLYACGSPKTVVCIMHPREFMACHYLVPDILESGCAAWSQAPRAVGSDLRLEHEIALHDVAAGVRHLREQGFSHIVLLGNSGGSGLYSLYVQQSGLAAGERIEFTPGGRPTRLGQAEMPEADGVVFVAPHPGQGAVLLQSIDPSVVDEFDPLSVASALDPLDPRNGFAEPPASSTYSAPFVARYRAAQAERVRRLDSMARHLISQRLGERRAGQERGLGGSTPAQRRQAAHVPVMTIWRTDADLRCFDLALDPSDRPYGSLWGQDAYTSNMGAIGFARLCTPESWLSTWSGLSSNALLSKTAPSIEQPCLLIDYTGDQACFPADVQAIYASIGSLSKRHERVRGDHHGRALAAGEEPGRYAAGRILQDWLRQNCPMAPSKRLVAAHEEGVPQ